MPLVSCSCNVLPGTDGPGAAAAGANREVGSAEMAVDLPCAPVHDFISGTPFPPVDSTWAAVDLTAFREISSSVSSHQAREGASHGLIHDGASSRQFFIFLSPVAIFSREYLEGVPGPLGVHVLEIDPGTMTVPEPSHVVPHAAPAILNHNPVASSKRLLHELLATNDQHSIALSHTARIGQAARHYTYANVETLSTRVARELIDAKVNKQIVPVILPQSPELYIAILGILKSGNAFCPILPATPIERITFICNDVKATQIFIEPGQEFGVPIEISRRSVCISDKIQGSPIADVEIGGNDLAYTMYTSGSTGTPKAVMIPHSAATTSILAHDEIFCDMELGDKFLQFANSTFDISIFEIFSAWARGMTLVSAERNILLTRLSDLIHDQSVSYLELTPSVASLLPNRHDHRMRSVKKLITIGEMLTRKVISNWAGRLVNAYGPSEPIHLCCLCFR